MPDTLILSPRFTSDSQRLRRAALAEGWPVLRPQRFRLSEDERPAGAAVVYGEWLFVEVVAEQLGLFVEVPADDWLATLPERYRRRELEATTLGQARAERRERFIKPAHSKAFRAAVYADGSALPAHADDETVVLVAEPVVWTVEFRLFVRRRVVETSSVYLRGGAIAGDDDSGAWPASDEERDAALAFADELLGDEAVALPDAVVLDVGHIEGRGWAAVELNPAPASGLCGCDPRRALEVIAAACR